MFLKRWLPALTTPEIRDVSSNLLSPLTHCLLQRGSPEVGPLHLAFALWLMDAHGSGAKPVPLLPGLHTPGVAVCFPGLWHSPGIITCSQD